MPVPLLRLPYVVLDKVFKLMEFRELFRLSLCSKRVHLAVRNFRNKSIKLTLSVRGDNGIHIYLMEENKRDSPLALAVIAMPAAPQWGWRADKFGGTVFQEYPLQIISYWEDAEDGARSLLEHLSDLFCAPIPDVTINDNRFFWILDIIENLQGRGWYQLCMHDERNRLTDEQFRHLLVDLNPSKLYLKSQPSRRFRVDNFRKSYHELTLDYGTWLTVENLLTLDCVTLHARRQTFTVTQMNRFFRHVLIDGAAPRLVDFSALLAYDREDHTIVDGIRELLTPPSGMPQIESDDRSWKFCGILKRDGRGEYVRIECTNTSVSLRRIGNGLKINA